MSGALLAIRTGPPTIPTAFISGNGCGTVNCPMAVTVARAALQNWCGTILHNPLAQFLNPFDWPRVFGSQDSDAIVPLTSQTNQTGSATILPVVHSEGTRSIGFNAPDVLGDARTAAAVIQMLNIDRATTPTYRPLF